MKYASIDAFHAAQAEDDRRVCDLLRAEIDRGLPEADARIWHAHPVWFLDANPSVNLILWSWCSINGHDAQRYVDNMEILIAEYPEVLFVFMTGHAEGEGHDPTPRGVHANNELIRTHCAANGRVLFDFADIEAWDPDGNYFWDRQMSDNLDYSQGNWGVEWITANPGSELAQLSTGEGVAGYDGVGYCAHSDDPPEACINCVLKGRAAWWLFALASGWDPAARVVRPAELKNPNCADLIQVLGERRPVASG